MPGLEWVKLPVMKNTLKLLTITAVLLTPAALAQNNDVATSNATTADNRGATDSATDWGWLGIAGLLGLAGLAGRKYAETYTTTTPTTTTTTNHR